MDITVSIGDLVTVTVEDCSLTNLEPVEDMLKRVGAEALRCHAALAATAPEDLT